MNTRESKEKSIKLWMRSSGLRLDDLGFTPTPKTLKDLNDSQIESLMEDLREDKARREGEAAERRESRRQEGT